MEDWRQGGLHRSHLLGGEGQSGRSDQRFESRRRPSALEFETIRHPDRVAGEMGRSAPGEASGSAPLSHGLQQAIQGWTPARSERKTMEGGRERGLDGQPDRGQATTRRRSRRASKGTRKGREERSRSARGAKGSGNPWGDWEFRELRKQKQEKKEKERKEEEEEAGLQDHRDQGIGSSVRDYSSRPRPIGSQESQEESQEGGAEEVKKRGIRLIVFPGEHLGKQGLERRGRTPLRGGGSSQGGLQKVSWGVDPEYLGDDTECSSLADGTALGAQPRGAPSRSSPSIGGWPWVTEWAGQWTERPRLSATSKTCCCKERWPWVAIPSPRDWRVWNRCRKGAILPLRRGRSWSLWTWRWWHCLWKHSKPAGCRRRKQRRRVPQRSHGWGIKIGRDGQRSTRAKERTRNRREKANRRATKEGIRRRREIGTKSRSRVWQGARGLRG